MSQLALKQQLSEMRLRKSRNEQQIGQSKADMNQHVKVLKQYFGESLPDDPKDIPFETLESSITEEYDGLVQEATNLLNECEKLVSEAENEYNSAHGSTT